MSIGLTVADPSATVGSGLSPGAPFGMPRSTAVSMIFCGPLSMLTVMSTNAVLTEFSVAVSMLIALP